MPNHIQSEGYRHLSVRCCLDLLSIETKNGERVTKEEDLERIREKVRKMKETKRDDVRPIKEI